MSEERLAASALHLCALLCRELGWRPQDFWATTPAEIRALMAPERSAAESGISRKQLDTMMERERDG